MSLEVRTRKGDVITVEVPDSWVNYWDINPKAHGGLFTWFGDDGVTVVETNPPSSIPDDMLEGDHLVYDYYRDYDWFWETVDGRSHPGDILDRELSSLSHIDSLQQAAIDGHLLSAMAWSLARTHHDRQHTVADDDYERWLQVQFDIPGKVF